MQRLPGKSLDKVHISLDRLESDLIRIGNILNSALVSGDLRCTNIVDDGKRARVCDFDTSYATDPKTIRVNNNYQIEQLIRQIHTALDQVE